MSRWRMRDGRWRNALGLGSIEVDILDKDYNIIVKNGHGEGRYWIGEGRKGKNGDIEWEWGESRDDIGAIVQDDDGENIE